MSTDQVFFSSDDNSSEVRAKLRHLPACSMLLLFLYGVFAFVHFWNSADLAEHRRERPSVSDIVQGREALAVEAVYKDVFPIRDFSTGLLNAISFGIFDEARGGLIKGSDGWLFTDEEFSWDLKSAGAIERHLKLAADATAKLRQSGIEPILLLLPEKADVYRDKLGHVEPPASRQHYYADIRRRLLEIGGVEIPDLQQAFVRARKGGAVFMQSDTHWTVEGAGIAAHLVADVLIKDARLRHQDFAIKRESPISHMGDLYKFAKFSAFAPLFPQPGDPLVQLTAVPAEVSLDVLFEEETAPEVAIVGSSYSANPKWSFEAQLRAYARADVVNFAEEGKGPFAPMESFLQSKLSEQKQLKYVVWEMPLRYFDETKY
ncbi:hypothetical protein [Sinorhizobium sp. BJ1]|uniref:alginate O-acetyltransferase AlgX-related protein n=1 Tax=Sinorhizobium sp. BJ1 TaxID=2035455 RepID=UPI000BE8529C|nr:hypothetical protein [Sinorhizobium sp. BJ1]PDT80357.1 hypothetical protein CO676_28160 [Sinorhizobium sp. BJ1]